MAAVFFGAAPRTVPLTVYSAPSGTRATGASPQRPTAAVLPDGRITAPVGQTIFIGTNPQGIALSPDGRFAVVSNDAESPDVAPLAQAQGLIAGASLTVVDATSMRVTQVYHDPAAAFSGGVVTLTDPGNSAQTLVLACDGEHNLLRVFDLSSAGTLTLEQSITLPLADAPGYVENHTGTPTAVTLSPDRRTAYVVESGGDILAAVDIASRSLLGGAAVGFDPTSAAVADNHVYVLDAGLSEYPVLAQPARAPDFSAPQVDPQRASSLAIVSLASNGAPDPGPSAVNFLRMDPAPDGTVNVGGIIPSAIVTRDNGSYAYVALANVDRVAIVDLRGAPRVLDGLDLRLFPNAPYGTQPTAEALASDGARLYIALGGLNAVAVLDSRDPARLHRLGLIPTGWYPSALAVSHSGRFLYIVDSQGVDGWGLLQRVDLARLPLGPTTLSALRYNRSAAYARPNALVPPLRSLQRSNEIRHVFYISVGIDGYDAMLGDLTDAAGHPHGNGAASYELYPQSVTPNLHALAREYALADNLYAAGDPAASIELATAATATFPVERDSADSEDPDSYPRSGYVFNGLARAHETYRDYGALLQVSGYHAGLYDVGVPVLAALNGAVDLGYAAWNPSVDDEARASAFIADFSALSQQNRVPDFTYVWIPTQPGAESSSDRALGRIVEAISHAPQWTSSAIFIVPESFQTRRDHVDGSRIYAIVVSPYARPGFVDSDHLSIASVVKTEEEILGLPPLAVGDLLATDLAPCFTGTAAPQPYTAAAP